MGIKDTSFYGQKMIEEAVVPTAPRTGKAGSADLKMKGWPPFIASRKFVCYFFDSLRLPQSGRPLAEGQSFLRKRNGADGLPCHPLWERFRAEAVLFSERRRRGTPSRRLFQHNRLSEKERWGCVLWNLPGTHPPHDYIKLIYAYHVAFMARATAFWWSSSTRSVPWVRLL